MLDLCFLIIICIILLVIVGIAACYYIIKWTASSNLYAEIDKLPFVETALILGTAKLTQKGGTNHFFEYRMDAAELIFKNHKAVSFIVSGAGKQHLMTTEAEDMKMSLTNRGIPEGIIITDDTGYRTWDSLWQCLHTFNCNQVTVVSQRFHIERAIFIGRNQGMQVVGFCAKDVTGKIAYKMFLRECLARVKCILDCYL
ncbi:MAG: SanA/YdcF family protein, partial [Chitinophagaceae bacterium]